MKNGIFSVYEGDKKVGGPFKFLSLTMFDEALAKSESLDALREKVSQAISDKYRKDTVPDYVYPYIRDLFMDKVVWDMKGSLWQASYSVMDGAVTLGTPVEVQIAYQAVSNTTSESLREMVGESYALNESDLVDLTESSITMTIIKPGESKNARVYSADMLKRDYKVFEGAKMFVNHATEAEDKARPEGRVQDWAANMSKVWVEEDGTVKGKATVIDPTFKKKLEELKKNNLLADMGVSIRAVGEATKKNGKLFVERLVKAKSVDFVTFAGAGGQVDAMESAPKDDVDLLSEAQLREARPDLVSLIEAKVKEDFMEMKTVEQLTAELADAKQKLSVAEAANTENAKKLRVAEAQSKIAKLITEAELPKAAKDRLTKQFAEAESDDKVADAIKEEKSYIESVGGKNKPTKVIGMGESTGKGDPEDDDDDDDLTESFQLLGLDEKQSKIAARGRK